MNEREALKLALEALELEDMACRYEKDQTPEHITKSIVAIKEALANVPTSDTSQDRVDETEKQRHEQEPVIDKSAAVRIATALGWEPKRTWVGLTDEEIDKTHETQVWDARRSYARAIEAKLKEKNND